MISEAELAKLSYPGAPEILTRIPGLKSMKVLADVPKYESLTRPGGANPKRHRAQAVPGLWPTFHA